MIPLRRSALRAAAALEGALLALQRRAGAMLGGWSERRLLAAALAASLAATLVAAVSSDSLYQVDEYFQTVEFASHALGRTSGAQLCWEFAARIRPWLQPAAYALLARGALAAGLESPFAILRLLRVATGLFSWAALALFLVAVRPWFAEERWRRLLVPHVALACFVPYLAVRTSSETASSAFLLLALALLARGASGDDGGPERARHAFLAGGALGLAFDCRYQLGFAALGITLHAAVHGRPWWRRALPLAAGFSLAAVLGLAVDAWGYGEWVFTPWNYFRTNLLEGKAATFGTLPAVAYPFMFAIWFPPFGLLLFLGLVALWWKFPRHLLTWTTLPFFLGHSLVAHKEIRFMIPLLVPASVGLVLAWSEPGARAGRMGALVRWMEAVWRARATRVVNALALALLCLLPSPDNLGLQRFLYDHATDRVRWLGFSDPLRAHRIVTPFLWPSHKPAFTPLEGVEDLRRALAAGSLPAIVVAKFPLPAGAQELLEDRGQLVFASLPPALARVNLFRWVERADLYLVYRVAPAAP